MNIVKRLLGKLGFGLGWLLAVAVMLSLPQRLTPVMSPTPPAAVRL